MGYTFSGPSSADLDSRYAANALLVGEEAFPRELMNLSGLSQTSGQMRLTYFTARTSETSTQVRMLTAGTAAGATPTLCRIGIYQIAGNGDGTLVAATTNDTTLYAAGGTTYTRSWASSFGKVAGRRYAVGTLVVTAAATPTFHGNTITAAAEAAFAPIMALTLNGLSDLPASFTQASGSANGNRPYAAILP